MRYTLPRVFSESEIKFITIEEVKRALEENEFDTLMQLYHLFLHRDLKIAEGVEKRRDAILALEWSVEGGGKFMEQFLERFNLQSLLRHLTDAIYYGYAVIDMAWEIQEGYLYPHIKKIPPLALRYDSLEEEFYFLGKESQKIPLRSIQNKILFYNHTASEQIHNENLAFKILFYAILKHTAITFNMQYFDSLAIPPLIVKGSELGTEQKIQELIDEIVRLKSNSFGIFNDTITIESLKASNQADFLSLIRYFDDLIAQYITGGVLTGDVKGGSYALGKEQAKRLKEKVKGDAKLIESAVNGFLETVLRRNVANPKPVQFRFLLDDKEDRKELVSLIATLSQSGYEVQSDYIEEKLGIPIKRRAIEHNRAKALSYQEAQLRNLPDVEGIEEVSKILAQCSSFEEALSLIERMDNPKLEAALERLIFANSLLGALEE